MKLHTLAIIATVFILTPMTVHATEPKTAEECNQAMMDRWNIPEPEYYEEIDVVATFYTSLEECNGEGNAGKNAIGGELVATSLAVPRDSIPFGTKVYIEGIGLRIADDVGNPEYIKINPNGSYRLDVFMERIPGETDKQYKARIMRMGVVRTTAKVYYEED